jgi:simple sugar transport system permease protein
MSASAKLPRWAERGLLPLINLAAALILSGVVVKILGESPWAALKLLVSGALGTQEGIGYTLYYATNFIFTGLGVAVAYHAGLFNIGCEGQAYVGGLGSGLVALWLGDRAPLLVVLPVAIMAGAAFGAAWALIPAWLQARRGSHIVITTIMFNFIAASLMTYLLVNVLIKPGQQSPESREFGANAFLPAAHELFAKIGITFSPSPWNLAFAIALLAAALCGCWCGARVGVMRSASRGKISPRPFTPAFRLRELLFKRCSCRVRSPAVSGSMNSSARSTGS